MNQTSDGKTTTASVHPMDALTRLAAQKVMSTPDLRQQWR